MKENQGRRTKHDNEPQPVTYAYRGVHARHPALAEAKQGIVVPGTLHGLMTPDDHNYLDFSVMSPYTSWTHSLNVAASFALSRGEGGIVLRVPLSAPTTLDTWSWEFSPDSFGEREVLLKGVRIGVEVLDGHAWANSRLP